MCMEKMNLINSDKLQHCSLCCLYGFKESVSCVQERARTHKDSNWTVQLSNMNRNVSPLNTRNIVLCIITHI